MVTNREFVRTLARVLRRPAIFPLPALMVRLVFGEMGETMLLGGQRVRARRLEETGFHFAYPTLDGALRHLLGAPEPQSLPPRSEDVSPSRG
jgi:NAD dependent epimerase/dehydratase family enzyme